MACFPLEEGCHGLPPRHAGPMCPSLSHLLHLTLREIVHSEVA